MGVVLFGGPKGSPDLENYPSMQQNMKLEFYHPEHTKFLRKGPLEGGVKYGVAGLQKVYTSPPKRLRV